MKKESNIKDEVIEDFWLRLDNAAIMYPAILNREFTTVFRLSAKLKKPVQIKQLFRAVSQVEKRFPYFKMQLKKGFFWHYLEHNNIPVFVQEDRGFVCRKFDRHTDYGLLFRILVKDRRISIEFSHILTDGTGALEFLKTLLITYFRETGFDIPPGLSYLRPDEPVKSQELEDSFHHHFKKDLPYKIRMPRAFHLPYKVPGHRQFHTTYVTLKMEDLKSKARASSVSITEYLVSVYLCTLQGIYREMTPRQKRKAHKILRIQVPVNLRNIFPSGSMRNFTLFVLPGIDLRLGFYSFSEILKKVHHLMQLERDEKLISRTISRNVGSERDKVLRSIPLFMKSLILQSQYYALGANLYSGELTNLGRFDLQAPGLNDQVDTLCFVPPPPNKALKADCGVIGFRDKLVLTFGNITGSTEFERRFIDVLEQQGISTENENDLNNQEP